jgi:hypothetical protein
LIPALATNLKHFLGFLPKGVKVILWCRKQGVDVLWYKSKKIHQLLKKYPTAKFTYIDDDLDLYHRLYSSLPGQALIAPQEWGQFAA